MLTDQIDVRRLEGRDAGGWFRLRQHLWDQMSDEEIKAEMTGIFEDTEMQLVLVAENGKGELVGFLEASIRPFVEDCQSENVGYLEGWWIEPEYRRKGIGRSLVLRAEEWARKKGCREMASDSEIGNDLSLKAHLKLGYQETSRLVHLRKEL